MMSVSVVVLQASTLIKPDWLPIVRVNPALRGNGPTRLAKKTMASVMAVVPQEDGLTRLAEKMMASVMAVAP